MSAVTFTDIFGNSTQVELEECIPLELKLNLTRYGEKYRELGNFLYKYKTQYGYSGQLPSTKMVSAEELEIIYYKYYTFIIFSNIYNLRFQNCKCKLKIFGTTH